MAELFASGRIIDIILGLLVLEAAVLLGLLHVRRKGPAAFSLLPNFLAGACLLLAVRSALAGAAWGWVAGILSAALVGHAVDLYVRFRQGR